MPMSGGVALLNHRLHAFIPAGWENEPISRGLTKSHDAEGIKACSRWLSEATPPENEHTKILRTLEGVPPQSIHHATQIRVAWVNATP